MKSKIQGVTLVELMVTLGIAAILLTLATPSFRDLVFNSRQTTQANEFVLAMSYAKSEAVKRGQRVTVCGRATDAACVVNTTWDNGWLVFVDHNGDGIVSAANPPTAADQVLQVRPPLEGGNTLRSGVRASVTFQGTGFINPGNSDTFNLCDKRGKTYGSAIVVFLQGWLKTSSGATTCP